MDTKTWIALVAGFAALGLPPAHAADQKEPTEMRASEREVEKNKNEAADEADARADQAGEEDARRQKRERARTEEPDQDRRVNPNAI